MEKVSAMKKVALFMMTKRVVRPMKFAAFISIIISVAVMLAACQGPVGKPGDDGTTGPTGPTGPKGPAGDDGVPALNDKVGDTVFITKAGTAADEDVDPATEAVPLVIEVNVGNYFVGGNPVGRAYELFSGPVPILPTTVTHGLEGSTLTLTVDDEWEPPTGETPDYVFTVSADDTDGQQARATINVRSNAAPTRAFNTATEVTVGTTDAAVVDNDDMTTTYGSDPVSCGMLNECVIDLAAAFADNNAGDDFTLTLDDIDEDDVGKVAAVIEGTKLTITGMKAAAAFSLMVKGTDEAGIDADAMVEISITVDGAPTVGPISDQTMKVSDVDRTVGTATDPGTPAETVTVTVTSSDSSKATGSETAGVISISSHNEGVATITVTVTESGGQPVQKTTDEFTVTVTAG